MLTLDVGSLMGSLVGQSEERTRQALRIIDAMAPAVLMIDEVEKAFAGMNGSSDSGVTSRMFGWFLSWLNDHESDVFVICTANDISRLPSEFTRSGRFDGLFFLDLPNPEEKQAIWDLYRNQFEIDRNQRKPSDDHWTGAEIKACCRLSALLDVSLIQAAQNVVPVAVTAAESVEKLRTWANGRYLSANQPGLYRWTGSKTGSRRKVNRDSSLNHHTLKGVFLLKHRLNNGSLHEIKDFDRRGNIVLNNGWTVSKEFGFIDYGYVVTSHASRG